jgi:aquaporin Z
MKQYGAEFVETFWLVLGGCGSAVLAAAFPGVGIGLLGVSLAFGLTVLTMAYAIGHIGLSPQPCCVYWALGGRTLSCEQVAAVYRRSSFRWYRRRWCSLPHRNWQGGLRCICRLCVKWLRRAFARRLLVGRSVDYRSRQDHDVSYYHSRSNRQGAPQGFAQLAIGLGLTLIHLISIPVTNTSVNPARSTGVALFVGDWAIAQL